MKKIYVSPRIETNNFMLENSLLQVSVYIEIRRRFIGA